MTHPTPEFMPCPFCGGSELILILSEQYGGCLSVVCENCGVEHDKAGWNTRADKVEGLVRALEEIVRDNTDPFSGYLSISVKKMAEALARYRGE